MARTPEMQEIIRRAADGRLLDVRTSMAGEIVSYNAGTRRAVVRPGVRVQGVDSDSRPEVDTLADIPDVPVMFPGGAAFEQFWPLMPGDPVRLEWSEEDDNAFYDTMAPIPLTPEILRRHGASLVCRPEGNRGPIVPKLTSISSDGAKVLLGDALGVHSIPSTELLLTALIAAVTAAPVTPADGGAAFKAGLIAQLGLILAPAVSLTKAKGT